MVVVLVVGIIAAVAVPIYQETVRKGRRSDAVAALTRIQQAQERFRSNNASYASDLATLGTDLSSSAKGYYQVSLSGVSAQGYTVTATAVSGSPQAGDTECSTISVTQSAGNLLYGGTNNSCWAR